MTKGSHTRDRRSFTDFLVHIHPRTVPEETLRFSLSLGLGGMAATLLGVLFFTGLLQLLMYSPDVDSAYRSVQEMYTLIPLGGLIRNVHFWAGNLLIIVISLHLLRVFLTGAFGEGRQLNWVIGAVLLLLALGANFSGYLLPWDQLAYWAVTIFTGMFAYLPFVGTWLMELLRGGGEVGAATLANFYGIHIGVIPVCIIFFCIWHFWLIRRAGGLIQREKKAGENVQRVHSTPHLVSREAAVGLGLVASLVLFSALMDAPLADPANPGMSPNPAKAAWYFLGLQELLLHLHPLFAICVVPFLALLCLFLLPYGKGNALSGGLWFGGERGRKSALYSFLLGAVFAFSVVVIDDKLLRTMQKGGTGGDIWFRGILPVALFLILLFGVYQLLTKKYGNSRACAVMAGVMFHLGILVGLTAIGIWFRGPGMQLMWPFG